LQEQLNENYATNRHSFLFSHLQKAGAATAFASLYRTHQHACSQLYCTFIWYASPQSPVSL